MNRPSKEEVTAALAAVGAHAHDAAVGNESES